MSAWVGISLVCLGCGTTAEIDDPTRAPTATVLTPTSGTQWLAGRVELRGQVSDPLFEAETLFTVWLHGDARSDDDDSWTEACSGLAQSDGTTLCAVELTEDDTRIRLVVTNAAGFVGVDEVDVGVFAPEVPEVVLLAPESTDAVYAGSPFSVRARVSDADHAVEALALSWRVEGEGAVDGPNVPDGTGLLDGEVVLDEGQQTLTLVAEDPTGAVGMASVELLVRGPDQPPTCRIDGPSDGAAVEPGDSVLLQGAVWDEETEVTDLLVSWTSDIDGDVAGPRPDALGMVDVTVPAPSLGRHVISLSAIDGRDGTCEATRTLWVDTPPTVTWLAPADGASITLGTSVTLELSVTDALSPSTDLMVDVTSSLDGPRASTQPDASGQVSVATFLSAGAHTLTATATDPLGLTSTFEVDVTVIAP